MSEAIPRHTRALSLASQISTTRSATVYIDWGFYFRYALTEQLDLYAGGTFTHFSNGRLNEPNLGLNTIGPLVSLRYNNWQTRPVYEKRALPPFEGFWRLVVAGSAGSKGVFVPTTSAELEDTDTPREVRGVQRDGSPLPQVL